MFTRQVAAKVHDTASGQRLFKQDTKMTMVEVILTMVILFKQQGIARSNIKQGLDYES
jgi:hypothetical protein